MFTLAHFSDPHISPLPPAGIGALLSQRVLGYLSWRHRRRHIHRQEVLEALAADLGAVAPDHVAITGDIANISLPAEFVNGARWLRSLGPPDWITVIPGNHDAYVALPWESSLGLWAEYMTGEWPVRATPRGFGDFPFVRVRGDVALVGLSSACPTPPFFASGTLGEAQIAALEDRLHALGRDGLFRVVLVHHPPLPGGARWRKRLTDAPAFRGAISRAGAELVLYGHTHNFGSGRIEGPGAGVPVMGVPSASATSNRGARPAHYHVYTIRRDGGGWRIGVAVRGLDEATGAFVPVREYDLDPAAMV